MSKTVFAVGGITSTINYVAALARSHKEITSNTFILTIVIICGVAILILGGLGALWMRDEFRQIKQKRQSKWMLKSSEQLLASS